MADTSLAAVIGFGGYYGEVAGPSSSPLDRLGEAPPFLFLHGVNDSSVLVEDAREFAARLSAVSSSPVVLNELPGAQHAELKMGSSHDPGAARHTASLGCSRTRGVASQEAWPAGLLTGTE